VAETKKLLLQGKVYDCRSDETVLEALLRQKVDMPHCCHRQTCMTCMLRALNAPPPPASQVNMKETLRMQNNFLACGCHPERDMEIALPQEVVQIQMSAAVEAINPLNASTLELVLQCDSPVDYRGGQSVLLFNQDQVGKHFHIASPTSTKTTGRIEVHVERTEGSCFSEWIHEALRVGDTMTVSGIAGELCYTLGHPQQPLFLAGWNGGLGALLGVVQDAFENGHSGPVRLFHGVDSSEQLYFRDELSEIGRYCPNFSYTGCIREGFVPEGCQLGPVDQIIRQELPDLSGWKVFLCGNREPVHAIRRYAYLAGADMKEIYAESTSL